jgi:hypothetical protein
MESHEVQPDGGEVDRQVLVLLQQHRRLTFIALADSFPTLGWRSLFMALHRLCRQQHVELIPLAEGYEVVWRFRHKEPRAVSEEACFRM